VARAVAPPPGTVTKLEVFKEGERPPAIVITRPFHILGRNSETSDTAVEGDTVSRQHAAFFHDAAGEAFVRALSEVPHMPLARGAPRRDRVCVCVCVWRVGWWLGPFPPPAPAPAPAPSPLSSAPPPSPGLPVLAVSMWNHPPPSCAQLMDLGSAQGTFLNGVKVLPKVEKRLQGACTRCHALKPSPPPPAPPSP
jgi:hypothetical protein